MKKIFVLFVPFLLFFNALSVSADSLNDYNMLMKDWDEKINLASQFLDKAEQSLKNGDALQACSDQSKASEYGIAGTRSLIKAFEISGTTDDLSNLESGINKWKEIGEYCS